MNRFFLRTLLPLSIVALAVSTQGNNADELSKLTTPPENHYTDYSGLICHQCIERDNKRLADFERETSIRIFVVVHPTLPAGVSMADCAQSFFKGLSGNDPDKVVGIVVLTSDHKVNVEVSPKLRSLLTPVVIQRIVKEGIMPGFQRREVGESLGAGLSQIMAALSQSNPSHGP
jgi:uncharacterized membrane protein YgcG